MDLAQLEYSITRIGCSTIIGSITRIVNYMIWQSIEDYERHTNKDDDRYIIWCYQWIMNIVEYSPT